MHTEMQTEDEYSVKNDMTMIHGLQEAASAEALM
jgi:hypothetical protein